MGGGFLSLRLAGGLVWWNARESYQENRAETNFESVEEIQHFLHMLNSYCTHTASIILNHWKLEFFWNYLQASTQRICVLRSQYCCVLKAIQFGKVAVFYYYFFFTKSCCRNLSVFGAVLVAFFVVVVVSVVCWSSRLTMIMTDKALGMKSSGSMAFHFRQNSMFHFTLYFAYCILHFVFVIWVALAIQLWFMQHSSFRFRHSTFHKQ